jgi:hypothetical protein
LLSENEVSEVDDMMFGGRKSSDNWLWEIESWAIRKNDGKHVR